MNSKLLTSNITKNQLYEEYISESLLDLGVKANRKGFIYIKEAIKIYPEIMNASKKIIDLYTIIAEHYNVTSVSVERAIRALLERTWCSENMNTSHVIFDCPYINTENVPTNSVFIATMSEILRCNLNKKFLR